MQPNREIRRVREILAKWMISHGYATGHGNSIEDLLKELEWQIKEQLEKVQKDG